MKIERPTEPQTPKVHPSSLKSGDVFTLDSKSCMGTSSVYLRVDNGYVNLTTNAWFKDWNNKDSSIERVYPEAVVVLK